MPKFICIFFLICCLASCGHHTNTNNSQPFYISYSFSGLGSNIGSFQPRFILKGSSFIYTYEQNSYFGEKNERKDTVCMGSFNQASIDSINYLIREIKDSSVYHVNPCMMSGGVHFFAIVNGPDITTIELHNTFDTTSIKILSIINGYLPVNNKILTHEDWITMEKDCWARLLKD